MAERSPPGTICRVKTSKSLVGGCHVFVVKEQGRCERGYWVWPQMVWYSSCQSMVMTVNGYILTKGEMRSVQSLFKLGRRKSKTKNDEHTRTRSSSGSLLISTTRPLLLIKLDSASNQSCFLQQDPTNLTEFLMMPHFCKYWWKNSIQQFLRNTCLNCDSYTTN